MRKYQDKEWLEKKYLEEELTMKEIGELVGRHSATIGKWLHRLNIPTRDRVDYTKQGKFQDEVWLKKKYCEEKLSTREIAELTNCCSRTVSDYLNKFGIEARNVGLAPDKQLYRDKEWLKEQFVENNFDVEKIAQRANCSVSTVRKYLHKRDVIEPSKKWKKITCDQCGKRFQRVKNKIKDSNNFCSLKCAKEAQKTGKKTVECSYCGKKIKRWPYQVEQQNKFFCSKECEGRWVSKNQTGELHPNHIGKAIVHCSICGKILEVHPYRIDRSENFFCSTACKSEWQTEHNTGPDNPNWKGGSSYYYGSSWDKQRWKTRERDENICQMCGATRNLQVHHLVPFRKYRYPKYKEEVKNPFVEFNWKKANRLDNLITLCVSCHNTVEGMDKKTLLKNIKEN